MKNWFKYVAVSIGLITAIALVAISYGVYTQIDAVKYEIVIGEGSVKAILNTKTGQLYFFAGTDGFLYYDINGHKVYIKKLP